VDFRQFYGWDKLAEQLRSLTVKRANMDDPYDLFVGIVLDDMDKRRRRSSKAQFSPRLPGLASPSQRFGDMGRANSSPVSPAIEGKLGQSISPKNSLARREPDIMPIPRPRTKSTSPTRPGTASRHDGSYRHMRISTPKVKRSGSGSSNSSSDYNGPNRSGSSSNLLSMGILPASKWRFLKHLSIADNSLTYLMSASLAPLANSLHSLDLSSNLFTEIPDGLPTLTQLRALNLSNCMIESLHSLTRAPFPAITALNLRANRLVSIAGIESISSLERLDLRENKLQDPTELARLTAMPSIHEVWVLRNKFVKTHSNYRTTIFNLFRSTPGYSEDVVIDGTGPSYSERRQLGGRVSQPDVGPTDESHVPDQAPDQVSEPHEEATPSTLSNNRGPLPQLENMQRPLPQQTQSEFAIGSGRRKKGPRRRIVDLARDASAIHPHQLQDDGLHFEVDREPTQRGVDSLWPKTKADPLPPFEEGAVSPPPPIKSPLTPTISTVDDHVPQASTIGRSLANEIQSLDLNGEVYRQKIEALKDEVGSNWLNVLSEQSWNGHLSTQGSQFDRANLIRPEAQRCRAASQGIVSGNRSLG